jgi:phosphogluconate dehydratase
MMHDQVQAVTRRICRRSARLRAAYLDQIGRAAQGGPHRRALSCGNLAHGFAAAVADDKARLRQAAGPNLAIVTAYNDMLSAHQPFGRYPEIIKLAAREVGATAQVAGGVPAMCDGITQGQPGMELSLFSRDVIAMATAVALSHNMFDAVLCLGVCDKIVPGLLIGALGFGHLPAVFVPAGPMPSGLANAQKARVRAAFAQGKASRRELLEAEARSYHSPGTCTFYGTANSNQMLMEVMGLHMPGAAFVPPGTPLRAALTRAASHRAAVLATSDGEAVPVGRVVSEKAIVNAIVALLATGGSTNHTIHLVAIARAAGIVITWDDFADLAAVVPLIARVYPNGEADVNHFHAAGGTAFVIGELLDAGLLHGDVLTVAGGGLAPYTKEPALEDDRLVWRPVGAASLDEAVLRPAGRPFSPEGGLRLLTGNLGRAVIKVSAVAPAHHVVSAPAAVFDSQQGFLEAFRAGALDRDVVAVIRFQGPAANGMPELHKLTPSLGVLQDRGYKVALVTDGRMSGASGKVPAAIHVTPEAGKGGPLARLADGDMIRLDAAAGRLEVALSDAKLAARPLATAMPGDHRADMGRGMFAAWRAMVAPSEAGADVFGRDNGECKS